MGDNVTIRMALQDGVSPMLSRLSSRAMNTANQLTQMGQRIDRAFNTNSPRQLASRIGSAANEAGARLDALAQAARNLGGSLDGAGDGSRLEDLINAAEEASRRMRDLSDSTRDLDDELDDLGGGNNNGLGDLGEDADDAGASMQGAGLKAGSLAGALKTLFAVVAGAAILGKVREFASDAIELGRGYTSMMSEVQAISGASAADMEQLEATARQYGATTVFSASEAAEALKYMSLAGWDANKSSSALGGVLNLAASSGMGLGQASDMVTDYLSAFGMEAEQAAYFADMLAFAQSNSNTTAEALGEAYRNSAANMHAAGQDVETATSFLEAMANQGYKGSEAGTALAAVMRDITQKMEDGAIKIGDASIAVQDESGNFRDLTDIMTEVEGSVSSMGDAQRAAALGNTFTADSIKAINFALAEGMGKISGYEEALRGAGGTAEKMAGIMNDNLSGDMANMNSAFEEMQLQAFEKMEQPLREGAQYITGTVIPILTDWVPDAFGALSDGVAKLGNALKPLFEAILKNPQAIAGAFSSLGAGLLAMKGVSGAMKIGKGISQAIENAGSLSGALGKLASSVFGNPWAAGAAAIAGAVTAIGYAIHSYNQMQIQDSLEAHFGGIELDGSQIEDFASQVLNAEWLVNVHTALGRLENADSLAEEAEEALAANDAIEWKARLGIRLDGDDKEAFLANIEAFMQASLEELDERGYAGGLMASTLLAKDGVGQRLAADIGKWMAQDMAEVSTIKNQLTNLVEMALEDGIMDVDEQAAIDILQGKINSILSGWKSSEAQAQMDLITQRYGRLSGKDLTEATYTSIVEELEEQRKTAEEALEAGSLEFFGLINGLMDSGRLTESKGGWYKERYAQASRDSAAGALAGSLEFQANTLEDTYRDKINKNRQSIKDVTQEYISSIGEDFAYYAKEAGTENIDYGSILRDINFGIDEALSSLGNDKNQKALKKLFELSKPDVEEMEQSIDEYIKEGQKVPEKVAESYRASIETGAAAGDMDAAWELFAQQMVSDPVNKEMVKAIQAGAENVPEELRSAVGRAMAIAEENVAKEPITIDGMTAELQDMAVDADRVHSLLGKAMEGVEATGNIVTLEGGMVAVEYEVTAGQSLSEIAAQAGIAIEELLAANPEIENPNVIEVGQKIFIPPDKVDVDASGIGRAANEVHEEAQKVANETISEPIETEQEVRTVYKQGEEDKSGLAGAAGLENPEPVEQTVPVSVECKVMDMDDGALASAIQDSINRCTVDISYESVTSALGNDISSAIGASLGTVQGAIKSLYGDVGGAIDRTFSAGFQTSADVAIRLDYRLLNPIANIALSGGGSGNAIVKAAFHADGGYFDQPHLGIVAESGGEYIIPMDGSRHSVDMWADAGRMLGIGGIQDAQAVQPAGMARGIAQPAVNSERTVNVNINGKGAIAVSGGITKEQVVDVMLEKARDVFLSILNEEIMEEGDLSYDF